MKGSAVKKVDFRPQVDLSGLGEGLVVSCAIPNSDYLKLVSLSF